jgi:DNA-binding response OmpR family regulator
MSTGGAVEENSILVIDDDRELCELLGEYLGQEGFAVESANDAAAGLSLALSGRHALVVLDVMLPGMSGFEVLRRIRERSRVPVLMLTARGTEVDRIVGLEMGADDYLPKPFNPRELVARIRAVQRRVAAPVGVPGSPRVQEPLEVGDVTLEPGTRTVRRGGEVVALTSVEFSVLEALLRAAGRAVSREELARTALGRNLSIYDRSIDVHVSSLRRKLGRRVGALERIRSVRGIGYQYSRPSERDA